MNSSSHPKRTQDRKEAWNQVWVSNPKSCACPILLQKAKYVNFGSKDNLANIGILAKTYLFVDLELSGAIDINCKEDSRLETKGFRDFPQWFQL